MAHAIVGRVAYRLPPSVLAAVVAAVVGACGNGTVATRTPVETFNRQSDEVKLVCPEEVDKGEQFDCTLQGTKTGKTATVRMEGLDDKDTVVDAADGPAFNSAVQQVKQP